MTVSRPARRVPWAALVALAAAVLFFARMRVKVDPDVFFHLKEGGRVLSERRLPLAEDYSFTRAGKAMIATEWLSGAAFAALSRAGGYPLLSAFCAALLGAALWLTSRVWDDEGPPEEARAFLLALAAFGLLNFALAKVQNFTFLFFALDLWLVRRWERGDRRAPWAMAALLLPWVNLHGGFTLGWVLLAGVCGLELLETRRAAALAPWAAGTFACFLHPNGATAFAYPIWFVFAAPAGRGLVLEWRPAALEASVIPYALILGVAVLARVDRLRSRFPWMALALVLLAMGLRSRKMLPFFSLAAVAASGLALARAKADDRTALRLCLGGALGALIMIAALEAREAQALAPLGPASDWQREYPKEAAEKFLERDAGKRLFHAYEWGGYLLWKLPSSEKVFIDGRLDPYWTLLPDYETMIRAAPGWRELADAYGIQAALLPPRSALAGVLRTEPGWRAVGTDGRAVLYERVGR